MEGASHEVCPSRGGGIMDEQRSRTAQRHFALRVARSKRKQRREQRFKFNLDLCSLRFFRLILFYSETSGFLIFCFLICPGQNHSEDAVLENRLMKVDPESFRGLATARHRTSPSDGGLSECARVLPSLWEVMVRLKAMRGRHRTPKSPRAKCLNPFVFFVSFC
jgi:hypothetical protein